MSQTNGKYYEFCVGPYMRHDTKGANDEISTNATAFTANEPIYWENSGNFCV